MQTIKHQRGFVYFFLPLIIVIGSLCIFSFLHFGFLSSLYIAITVASIILTIQATVALILMMYVWGNPQKLTGYSSPKEFSNPKTRFSVIIPARHEEKVISNTLETLSRMQYPQELYEICIVCKTDDLATISQINKSIKLLGKDNIRLVTFESFPINKPHALNIGLQYVTKDVVVIFDAEDEVHTDLFSLANTVMQQGNVDVLQSGVQLMNYDSRWFSALNILEYFFWFKSTLQFFSHAGIVPLGGNTVFFKKEWLEKVGGWDENCLTEDADIGIRLSNIGAKIRIVYDEKHVTREEAPLTLPSFIKQRTRWNQGFIQILFKGGWLHLPTLTQRVLAVYILTVPEVQAILFLYVPISILLMLFIPMPIWIALLSIIPLYLLFLQLIVYNIGFYLFTKDYQQKYSWVYAMKLLISYLPYQLVLGYCASRATLRLLSGKNSWEKTAHENIHRTSSPVKFAI